MIRWRSPATLRSRLALWCAIGGTIILTCYLGALYRFVNRYLPVEHRIRLQIASIHSRLQVVTRDDIRWDGAPIGPPESWPASHPWFELWDDRGRLVLRRWPFGSRPELHTLPAPVAGRDVVSIYNASPDLRLRTIAVPFPGPAGRQWMLQVMKIHEPAVEILANYRLILFLSLPAVVLLLVGGSYALARHWLRPFDRLAQEIGVVGREGVRRRVSVPEAAAEIAQVANVFNQTLDALEDAFVALDRFVADASHEMRTPLTALRNVGELALALPRPPEAYRDAIGSMLEEAGHLQDIAQRLLELARAEGGGERVERQAVRLDVEVARCIEEVAILAEARRQRLILSAPACEIATDLVLFRQSLRNLLDNAIKFSPDGSAIAVNVSPRPGAVAVEVQDEGPGIRPEDRAKIAQRFFRADNARSRSGGYGLGLAITKAYLRILGGSLEYEPRQPRGSLFRIILPRSPAT